MISVKTQKKKKWEKKRKTYEKWIKKEIQIISKIKHMYFILKSVKPYSNNEKWIRQISTNTKMGINVKRWNPRNTMNTGEKITKK